MDDQQIEKTRYNKRAEKILKLGDYPSDNLEVVPLIHRQPYQVYRELCRKTVRPETKILELGAGTGEHSIFLGKTGADVTCTDIADTALEVLLERARRAAVKIKTVVTPMEKTPFQDSTFDLVVIAGGLSYADPNLVDAEIIRVLKPGGKFICIDSLNHNPIYKLNRYIHWMFRGSRSRSTIQRIPTYKRLTKFGNNFENTRIQGFGSWLWFWIPIAKIIGESIASDLNIKCEKIFGSNAMSFKFVFEADSLKK
jgi:ubiquinone/menaquinone biosynthesis C-methylase UbiE